MEEIKIRIYKDENSTRLMFYEKAGDDWKFNGLLTYHSDIAYWLTDAIRRGRSGRVVLIIEEDR